MRGVGFGGRLLGMYRFSEACHFTFVTFLANGILERPEKYHL